MSEIVAIQNETLNNLVNDLQLQGYEPSANMETLANAASRYIKDLKINVSNALNNTQYLNRKEALLLGLAVAINEKFDLLKQSFTNQAKEEEPEKRR